MAEERTLGAARATAPGEEDATKAELQRRMEEARESISQTVGEIKETVTQQYQSVKDSISETLDWREQVRRRPVGWSAAALGVGFLVGFGVAGVFRGNGREDDDGGSLSLDDTDVYARTGATPARYEEAEDRGTLSGRLRSAAYEASPAPGGAYGRTSSEQETARSTRPSYSSGYEDAPAVRHEEEEAEDQGPSLFERFKETRAFDRLQEEVGQLGDRLLSELSKAAQDIVLPALFAKVKDMVGVDLSGEQHQRQATSGGSAGGARQQAGDISSSGSQAAGAARPSGPEQPASRPNQAQGSQTAGGTGDATYGTSVNRDFGPGSTA